jgi:hypothetical protein
MIVMIMMMIRLRQYYLAPPVTQVGQWRSMVSIAAGLEYAAALEYARGLESDVYSLGILAASVSQLVGLVMRDGM